jgi:hypothetical protein
MLTEYFISMGHTEYMDFHIQSVQEDSFGYIQLYGTTSTYIVSSLSNKVNLI